MPPGDHKTNLVHGLLELGAHPGRGNPLLEAFKGGNEKLQADDAEGGRDGGLQVLKIRAQSLDEVKEGTETHDTT